MGSRLRADARRNLEQILSAALQVFALRGPDVPMEEVARTAGVGVGTLYRRFPDRDALVRAVARDVFAQLLAEVRTAAAEEETAWDAVARMVGRSFRRQAGVQLVLASTRARQILCGDPETTGIQDALTAEFARLVEAAQAEGAMRTDIGAGDVVFMFSLVLRQLPAVGDTAGPVFERAALLILDGLRAGTGRPLPGRPLTGDDISFR